MKKLIVLSLMMIGMSNFALAQGKTEGSSKTSKKSKEENKSYTLVKEVKFDFGDGDSISVPRKIKTGDFYRVKVNGVNLNNYRVELQIKDTVYYSKALEFPVFGSIDISSLEGIVGTFSDAISIVKLEEADSLNMKDEKNIPLTKNVNIDSLLLAVEIEKNNELYSDPNVLQDIEKVLANEKRLGVLLTKLLKTETDRINLLATRFLEARVASKSIENFELEERLTAKEAINTSLSLINNLDWLQKIADGVNKRFVNYFNNGSVSDLIKQAGESDSKKLQKEKAEMDKVYAELKAKITQAKIEMDIKKVEKNIVSIQQLYKGTTFTSLPIQFTGEEAEIKMSFIPKDSASNLQTYHLSPIKFGRSPWYWAVGPGMYYSNLENERVGFETIQKPDSTQRIRVLEENTLQGEIGVSALFHAGYKLPILDNFLGVQGSVGTGVSLGEEVRARLLYGIGLSFGRKNQLTLNFGGATGYVDTLSKSFAEEDFGNKEFLEKPSVLVKTLSTGIFWNVGYMFSF
ncbi:hypothetical protein [Algoriphagus formosus]|uniref:hypothetical protein n=1 Tax=Algoriphagus formosus TaxID=2007308 RepID=UPI003F71B7F0